MKLPLITCSASLMAALLALPDMAEATVADTTACESTAELHYHLALYSDIDPDGAYEDALAQCLSDAEVDRALSSWMAEYEVCWERPLEQGSGSVLVCTDNPCGELTEIAPGECD